MMTSYSLPTSAGTVIHARVTVPSHAGDNNKPLLVFVHYWGGSSATWHKLLSPSSPHTLSTVFPTVALDLRGWGQSTGPSDGASSFVPSKMAEDVVSVLRQLNQRESTSSLQRGGVVLIGHSMGAKVVLGTLSVFSPEEIQLLRGLVLVAPAPPTALTLPVEMQEQQKGAYESEASVRWTLENVLTNPSVLTSEDIENAVRDSLAGSVWAKQAWPTCGMEEDLSSVFESPTVKSLAENLNVDVLVGELDVVEPQARVEADVVGLFLAKGFRPALRVVPGVKHLVPLEAPDAIKHVVLDKY